MNEELDKKDNGIVSRDTDTPDPPTNKKRTFLDIVVVIVALIIIIAIGTLYFYSNSSKIKDQSIILDQKEKHTQSDVPDDLIFIKGFEDTGLTWPPKETDGLTEHNQNPLAGLRKTYCERLSYDYGANFVACFSRLHQASYITHNYNYADERFTLQFPSYWQADPEPLNYGFIAEPKNSLKRQGASCTVTYGVVDEDELLSSGNASTSIMSLQNHPYRLSTNSTYGGEFYGESIYYEKGLDKITLPFGRSLSDEEKAAGYTDLKIIAVPHFPYANSTFGFLLTSGDKQPLVEACISEFNLSLVQSVISYPSATLNNQSSGILSAARPHSGFDSSGYNTKNIALLFENLATGKEESISPEAFLGVYYVADPFLTKGKLFYREGGLNSTMIKTIDIFNGENKTVPLIYDTTKHIHSFFPKDDVLYYLMGSPCLESVVGCDLELKSYNLKSGASETLVSGIKSSYIEGFDATGDTLILSKGDGDVGCSWGSFQSFNLSTRSLKDIGSYSVCWDENDSYSKLENLVSGLGSFDHLVVKNGKIFSPSGTDHYQDRISIRVNTTEYPKDQ